MKTVSNPLRILNFLTEPNLKTDLLEKSKRISFEKQAVVVREGEYVKILPIVLSGAIRVFQTKEDREILLYYVDPGQTCMMSLSASFFNHPSAIKAVATEPTEILAIPSQFIAPWQQKYNSWNNFVIKTFWRRYDELLNVFESVAFDHVNVRILDYLERRKAKEGTNHIAISHQKLANELGTTRVVVSRILKQFELEGKVVLRRGGIDLC